MARRAQPLLRVMRLALASAAVACALGCLSVDVVDHGTTPCGPESCAGCCSANGRCLAGGTIYACGAGGGACGVCDPEEVCSAGVCLDPDGPTGPPDAGPDSACGPETCAGCCDGELCLELTEQSGTHCGQGGGACGSCGNAMFCNAGVCESTARCKLVSSVLQVGAVGVLEFGTTPVGTTRSLGVELKNAGAKTCSVTAPAWLGGTDTNAFGFGEAPITAMTIAPGQRAQFPVSFTPWAARGWGGFSNAFTLTANDGAPSECANNTPGCRRIVVRGDGLASAFNASAPLLPTTLDFGQVTVGCESRTRTVLLVNESGSTLTLQQLSGSHPQFEVLTPTPLALPPWGTARIEVRFLPTVGGPAEGSLTVTDELMGARAIELRGEGVSTAVRVEQFKQPSRSFADLLFVVHASPSMTAFHDELGGALPSFLQTVQGYGNGWQAGVIASDTSLSNAGLLQGATKYVTPGPEAASTLAASVHVGNAATTDRSLEALRLAVVPPNSTDPLRNAGFLREGAKLGVILLSDSTDKATGASDDYLDALYAATGSPALGEGVRLYPIVSSSACGSGTRLASAVSKTGGFCQTLQSGTLEASLENVASDLFTRRTQFTLDQPIEVSQPLVVSVDGTPVPSPSQYSLDLARNAVIFSPDYVPEPGQSVEVSYSADCHP